MDPNWAWEYKLSLSTLVIVITVIYSAVRRSITANCQFQKCNTLSGIEILQLIRRSKLFPLVYGPTWKLHDFCHDLRMWKGQLISDVPFPINLYGCYSKVKGSSQVVLKTLKDLEKYHEWQPKLTRVYQITRAQEAPSFSKSKTITNVPVQHDFVSLETEETTSTFLTLFNKASMHLRGEPIIRKLINVNRYWHREDNGCCWLLEVPEGGQEGWTFYLAQPVEEMDQCLLTIVHAGHSTHNPEQARSPAYRMAALQNYFLYRKVQCTPLAVVSLPSASTDDDQINCAEDITSSTASTPVSTSPDDILDQAYAKNRDAMPKTENNILRRFRNLIEEKREWYEERKRKGQLTSNGSSPTPTTPNSEIFSKLESSENSISEDMTAEANRARGDSESDLSECTDDEDNPDYTVIESPQSEENEPEPKPIRRKSLLEFLRSATQSEDTSESVNGNKETSAPKEAASRKALSLNLLKRGRSLMTIDTKNIFGTPDEDKEPEVETEEQKMKTGFQTMGNTVAAELISEKFKVSNLDISCSYDEQALQSGGWIYCGLEKEVVILRKMSDDGASIQSYLGKGIIPVPPKAVFEALKNPRTRFTYDEMLKKVDVLHDFEGGLKIVYLYHEVSQLFRKEARDFCLLQSERIEGFKYIISLKSVGWPDCPINEDITRGKFHSSGWIIEPANRDNKLYSMVTYIVQMELGTSKTNTGYLVEELAAKQPLSISHLRTYLAPSVPNKSSSAVCTNNVSEHKKSVPSAPMGTLAAAAAFASQASSRSHLPKE